MVRVPFRSSYPRAATEASLAAAPTPQRELPGVEKMQSTRTMDEATMFNMIKAVAEEKGCRLVDVDFENHTINIEGPEAAQVECALALERLMHPAE